MGKYWMYSVFLGIVGGLVGVIIWIVFEIMFVCYF